MSIVIISHPDCARHQMGAGHPECPERLVAITDGLASAGLGTQLETLQATPATRAQLQRVHTPEHVQAVYDAAPAPGRLAWLDPDTAMNEHTLSAALHAAGALVMATDLVMQGKAKRIFCNVRPPGHHAEHDRAMGFCFFNNVAVGVAHALAEYGLERVAILDFDVHHGNGTEDIFRDEQRVLLCSSFQHPLYPYQGADTVSDHIINVPLPAGTGSQGFRQAVTGHWLPALRAFTPQLLFISAGFDAHRDDPLASLALVEEDYAWVTRELRVVADEFCQGRVVSTLEGGYQLPALAASALAHITELL